MNWYFYIDKCEPVPIYKSPTNVLNLLNFQEKIEQDRQARKEKYDGEKQAREELRSEKERVELAAQVCLLTS